jgi:molybdopterin synthase catalytic subunit
VVEPLVRIERKDFDIAAEIERVRRGSHSDIGAVVSFIGVCRDESGRLAALHLEHYPTMAETEIAAIAGEAASRWPLSAISVIHRHGRIAPGENIVLVVTASTHRQAAFSAAEFLMDYLKSRAPFWKKEILADGSEGAWVDATESDEAARKRWREEAK